MYKLIFEKHVFKDLDKVPEEDLNKIQKIFKNLKHHPRSSVSKKLTGKPDRYRIRKGDYRIVYPPAQKTTGLPVNECENKQVFCSGDVRPFLEKAPACRQV